MGSRHQAFSALGVFWQIHGNCEWVTLTIEQFWRTSKSSVRRLAGASLLRLTTTRGELALRGSGEFSARGRRDRWSFGREPIKCWTGKSLSDHEIPTRYLGGGWYGELRLACWLSLGSLWWWPIGSSSVGQCGDAGWTQLYRSGRRSRVTGCSWTSPPTCSSVPIVAIGASPPRHR